MRRLVAGGSPERAKPPHSPLSLSTEVFANTGENPVVTSGWYKLCQDVKSQQSKPGEAQPSLKTTSFCMTLVDVRDEKTMVLVGKIGVRRILGQEGQQLFVTLPLNISLAERAVASIDKKVQIKLAFLTCNSFACFAEAKLSDTTFAQLKAGQEIAYTGADEKGGAVIVPISLSGFENTYQGAPTPQQVYNDEMRRVAEDIMIRASRARKQRQTP